MNDIYSFFQLISKFQIEVPIIQRDYAQGRNNSKSEDVRKSIVADMINAVKGEKQLFFDFVYGRIEENKFVPFDGQQRLTSLFLFHKYVFEKCQSNSDCDYRSSCICRDILYNFSYATRQSSREFCEQLVSNSVIPSDDFYKKIRENFIRKLADKKRDTADEKRDIDEIKKKAEEYVACKTDWMSVFIRNQSWFYPDWDKDPTIVGMLTMLDEIHNQFARIEIKDFKPLAEKLTSGCSCPITFHFVNMGEHSLSDETYVKMNARGKALTPFENFKASLEQYLVDTKNESLSSRIKESVDGKWLELFWGVVNKNKKKDDEKELPDSSMMGFFNRHFMNVWRRYYGGLDAENAKIYKGFYDRIIKEMPLYPQKEDFVSWEIYENVLKLEACGVNESILPVFNIWDKLREEDGICEDCLAVWNRGEEKDKKWNLYEGDRNNDNRETYPSRVAFYALIRYFGVKKEEGDKTSLKQWMRIVWNIIENSTIDSPETYQAALRLINKLSEKSHNIYEALANHFADFQLGSQYHAQDQVQEEIAKAKQILFGEKRNDGKLWEEIIIEAEKYAFFKGAIRFLFTDAKGKNDDWTDFDKKWGNAQSYFDLKGVKDDKQTQLTKSLVIQCDNWNEQLYRKQVFNPNATTWKWILTAKNWITPIHNILMGGKIYCAGEKSDIKIKQFVTPILENLPFDHIIKQEPEGRFRWYEERLCFYRPNGRDKAILDWDNWNRNKILFSLSGSGKIETEARWGTSELFWGWDINFAYEHKNFRWAANNIVYLMSKDNPNVRAEKDPDSLYSFDASSIDEEGFLNELLRLSR